MAGERSSFEQARRVLYILKTIQNTRIVRKQELLDDMIEKFPALKARSLERDLQVLQDEGFIISKKQGGQSYWETVKANPHGSNIPIFKISKHEMLSLYALKAYLKTFKGTSVESDVTRLYEKIERFAPGDAIVENTLYWDRGIGAYDYSGKQELIGRLLNFVHSKTWIKLIYQRMSDSQEREYEIFPQGLYSYSGSIYLIGYISKHKSFLDFAVHNIISAEESVYQSYNTPKFKFEDYEKTKFAVFTGEPVSVKIKIFKDAVKYFENRHWHITQKIEYDAEGNMILSMQVPITPDLVGTLLYWLRSAVVLEPKELRDSVKEAINYGRENYELFRD